VCAGRVDDAGLRGDHRVATEALHARDGQGRGELVPGDDRPAEGEALLAVDDPAEVDAAVGLGEELRERGLLYDDREGRRGDDIGVPGRACGLRVVVDRVTREDGTGELPHLLPTDEIGGDGREDPALQFGVDRHRRSLPGRLDPWNLFAYASPTPKSSPC